MTLDRFARKWTHPDSVPERVDEAELVIVEQRFGVRFPEDYRQPVLTTGLPHPTLALLDTIVERELYLPDIAEFFTPKEIVED